MPRFLYLSLVLILAGFGSSSVFADSQEGLLKDNPRRLGVLVASDDSCPFTQAQLEQLVDAEVVAHSLHPQRLQAGQLYLKIIVSCFKSQYGGGYVYNTQVDFVIAKAEGVMRPWQGIYGAFGVGQPDTILQSLGAATRAALLDYVDSNPALKAGEPALGSQ